MHLFINCFDPIVDGLSFCVSQLYAKHSINSSDSLTDGLRHLQYFFLYIYIFFYYDIYD